jgi:hypothetical protein
MKIEKVITIVLIAIMLTWAYTSIYLNSAEQPDLIPTRMDIQQSLVDAGWPIQVDGIIGPDTIRAWECEEEITFSERLEK